MQMYKINPYRPGAGLMPLYLAGRESDIEYAGQMFLAAKLNIPVQSVIFSGLRGVGKTVLVNQIQKNAEDMGIFCKYIEVETQNDFVSQIAACAHTYLREFSGKEKFKGLVKKAIDAVKSLVVSFDPNGNTFSLSVQERELYQSNNLTQSLTDVFTTIGETAYTAGIPICFFIDEMQYMRRAELSALIAALHRTNQLGYPVLVVGAGLPRIYKMLSDEKTYAERLFQYREIGFLPSAQAEKAVTEPARTLGVTYSVDAIQKIISVTRGYPFFIQQMCQIVYDNACGRQITKADVEQSVEDFFTTLDNGFFKVRYERCSESDKRFVFAMAACGTLPCTIANVARHLGKKVSAVSTIRAQLISKGLVYPVRYKELDFTVPEFDSFLRRMPEYQAWYELEREGVETDMIPEEDAPELE